MENNNISEGESTLGTIAICTGLILFLWSIFSIFYTFLANRTRRLILRAVGWWIVLLAQVTALFMLYDRVLNPLKDGTYRWDAQPNTLLGLGIIYVVICVFGMWDNARLERRESSQ